MSEQIDWEKMLTEEWLWDIDEKEGFEKSYIWDLDSLCDWNCNTCMITPIDDYKTKLGAILCCKSHPETWEVNPETNACPEYDMDNWKCKIYQTEEYPDACKNYHCKTHNR